MSNLSLVESLDTLSTNLGKAQSWVPGCVEDLREFKGWRHCSADGNTFYRAAGFAMVEAILRKKPKKIQQFANTLREAGSGNSEAKALERLLLSFQGMDNADALQEWYRKLCFDPDMDRALVRGVREASAEHLMRNPQVEVNDMPFSVLVQSSLDMSVEEFVEQRILQDGVEADDYVLALAPMAFGLRLEIIQVEPSGSSRYEAPNDKEGHAVASLLWRPGNFDIFYSNNAAREVMQIQERLGMHGGSSSSGAGAGQRAGASLPPSLLTSRQNRSSARHADEVVEAMRQSLEASLQKTETAMGQQKVQAAGHERKQQEIRDKIKTARLDLEADQALLEDKRKQLAQANDEVNRLRRDIQWMQMRKNGGLFACCVAPRGGDAGEFDVEDDGQT